MSHKRKYPVKGEWVKIINPMIFQKVGYPLDTLDMVRLLAEDYELYEKVENYKKEIRKILVPTISNNDGFLSFGLPNSKYNVLEKRLDSFIRMFLVVERNFGGNERKIFESEAYFNKIKGLKWFQSRPWLVVNKQLVKTGTRQPGRGYEPPYLADAETHCILTLKREDYYNGGTLRIRSCHIIPWPHDNENPTGDPGNSK